MFIKDRIHYQLTGKGPPLVFIHGLLGFWRNFYSVSQAFKNDYISLLYDQRGHGLSFHGGPYTIEQFALDLKDILDHLKWHSVALVGHSLGGYISYLFAYKHPEYVKKMLVVDSNPWPLPQTGDNIKSLLLSLPPFFDDRAQAGIFFKKSVENNTLSKATAGLLMANLEKNNKGPVKFLFDTQGILESLKSIREQQPNYPSMIKKLQIPTLILRGKNSPYFLESNFKKALTLNPLVIGKEIKNSQHWIHSEQPQAFKKILKNFLD